jgi:ribosomal protein S18 acetylase RimI-like enzyme
MNIRKIKQSDRGELFKLFLEFEDYYQKQKVFSGFTKKIEKYINKKKALMEFTNKYIQDKKIIAYVAEQNNKLIGFIGGEVKEYPTKILNKEGVIEELFVSNKFRNQKIGKKLFEKLVKEFKEKGCKYLGIEVFSKNKKTIDIYHNLGFQDYSINMKKLI